MPASSVATARCASSSAICRSSAGATSCAAIVRARVSPIAGNLLRPRARSIRRASHPRAHSSPIDRSAPAPCRAGTPAARARSPRAALHSSELAVELLRVRLQTREIRFGVGCVLDAMVAVEEARNVEIRADVLNDDVRRVAPAADGDVAVRQREPFERRRVRAAHDFDAGARRVRQPPCRRTVDARQIVPILIARRRLPASERSDSCDRRAARAPVSIPSDVALSGCRVSSADAMSSRSFRASASDGALGGGPSPHPVTSGRAAADASAARASRRLGMCTDVGLRRSLGRVHCE